MFALLTYTKVTGIWTILVIFGSILAYTTAFRCLDSVVFDDRMVSALGANC